MDFDKILKVAKDVSVQVADTISKACDSYVKSAKESASVEPKAEAKPSETDATPVTVVAEESPVVEEQPTAEEKPATEEPSKGS